MTQSTPSQLQSVSAAEVVKVSPPSARMEDSLGDELQGRDTEANSRFGAERNQPLPQRLFNAIRLQAPFQRPT